MMFFPTVKKYLIYSLASVGAVLLLTNLSLYPYFENTKHEAVVPMNTSSCSGPSGHNWVQEYQKLQKEMLQGDRKFRVGILDLISVEQGLGDRFRGLVDVTITGALTGRVTLFDWHYNTQDENGGKGDVLQNAFLPRSIMWNRTEVRTIKHAPVADIPSEISFLRQLVPVGISRRVMESDVATGEGEEPKWDERVKSRLEETNSTFMMVDFPNRRSSWKKYLSPLIDSVRVKSIGLPRPLHVGHMIKDSTSKQNGTTGAVAKGSTKQVGQMFEGDAEVSIIREELQQQSLLQSFQCATRMLFNTLAPPLREKLSSSLAAVAESYRSQALKLDAWPPADDNVSQLRKAQDEHEKCNGLTLTQCLASQLGVQTRPLVGIHYRVGDFSLRGKVYDKRNTPWDVREAVECGRRLATSLGFVRPVFLLMTDDEKMKNAIRVAQKANRTEVVFNTKTRRPYPIDKQHPDDGEVVEIDDVVVSALPPPKHISEVEEDVDKASLAVELFAEILTLATSDALVLTQSGFGRITWLFGGHTGNRVAAFNWREQTECVVGVDPDQAYWHKKYDTTPFLPSNNISVVT